MNLEVLLEASQNLESGHPVESVLARYGVSEDYSAYDVIRRHQRDLEYLDSAVTEFYKKRWKAHVKELKPVVKAIAECLKAEVNAQCS